MTKEKSDINATKVLNIYQRLHAAMGLVSFVQKEDKQVNNQYKFVSHDEVTKVTREALMQQGVIYFPQDMKIAQDGNRTEIHMNLRFINIDDPQDFLDVPTLGYGIDSQDKGPGKAMSYAVKYALLKALALETGDDPERDNNEHKPSPKPEKKNMMPVAKTGNRAIDDAVKGAMEKIKDCFDKEALDKVAPYQRKYLTDAGATSEQLGMLDDQIENKYMELRANDPFAF